MKGKEDGRVYVHDGIRSLFVCPVYQVIQQCNFGISKTQSFLRTKLHLITPYYRVEEDDQQSKERNNLSLTIKHYKDRFGQFILQEL